MISISPLRRCSWLLILLVLSVSCKKDKNDPAPATNPVISGIMPDAGPKGTTVTITGSRFSNDISQVQVFFNGMQGIVNSATTTEIVATVPPKAGTGNVTVYVGSESGSGPVFNFVYTIAVNTLCGLGTPGFADGDASVAKFNSPRGIAIDGLDNLYVADAGNQRIRRVSANGVVTTFAGSGVAGFLDGDPATAKFNSPYDVAYDLINNYLYVADRLNHCIRRLSSTGYVTTAAGIPGSPGYVDAPGLSARFDGPTGVAVEGELASVYIADANNHCIREFNYLEVVSTFAGSNVAGQQDGNGTGAKFSAPADIEWDSTGNLYVTDKVNHNIRKISPSGEVTTVAGSGIAGYTDAQGALAAFNEPVGISANAGSLLVADLQNQRIRGISTSGLVTTIAGDGTQGWGDGSGATAKFKNPSAIVRDSNGDFYVADTGNHLIRKIVID